MAYWIKVKYERDEYVVDLDRVSVFIRTPSSRLKFWLPQSPIEVILTQQRNIEDYQKVLAYVQRLSTDLMSGAWIQIIYEGNKFFIDLSCIRSFCLDSSRRLKFWLPDSSIPIILIEQNDPDAYHKVLDYIKHTTGQRLL